MRLPSPTYANVMSTVAVFIALGGTSYAAAKLSAKSVGERELKDSAVTTAKLAKGAVTADRLAAGVSTAGPRGPRGGEGPTGPKGDSGAKGDTGPIGPSEVINVSRPAPVNIPVNGGGSATLASVTVPAGDWILTGQTKIFYTPGNASEWFDCDLKTAAGDLLVRGSFRVGDDAIGVGAATYPLEAAKSFAASTQVSVICSHPSPIGGGPVAEQTVLRAVRVGKIEQR